MSQPDKGRFFAPEAMPIAFCLLDRSDARREEERLLRFHVLREPLGLTLADVTVEGEDDSLHLVALDDDRVVGCVLFTPLGERRGKLRQMAVAASHRGRGLGRALVLELERTLRERDFAEVVLHARREAVGFYEKLGFAAEGATFLEVGIPHRRMRKTLDR